MIALTLNRRCQSFILFSLLYSLHGLLHAVNGIHTPRKRLFASFRPFLAMQAMNSAAIGADSVHLKLQNVVSKSIACSEGDGGGESASGMNLSRISIYEYVDKANGSSILATSSTRSNAEHLSVHVFSQNLSNCYTNYTYQQVSYELSDKAAYSKYEQLWLKGRFLSSGNSFADAWKPAAEQGKRPSLHSLLATNSRRYMLAMENHEMRHQVLDFLMQQRILNQSIEHFFFRPENGLGNLHTLKHFATWMREQFPYFYGQCERCDSREAIYLGILHPSEQEQKHQAGRTELYRCPIASCQHLTRFPRYIDVSKVLATRKGRCGEYSVLMLLFLQSLGYTARWVVDREDHVWVEVRIGEEWLHVDPCEAAVNEPLLYQAWGKNQTFILAFDDDLEPSIQDRTFSYTSNATAVEERRAAEGVQEAEMRVMLAEASQELRRRKLQLDQQAGYNAGT